MNFDIINNFFDKIYVLTLERATERHLHFKKELEGLNYTIFYGKDKKDFDIKNLIKQGIYDESKARKIERYSRPMAPGMLGCSWSHKLIYEEIIKYRYKKVLIMEDDIVINKNNWHLLPHAFNELPLNWELLYFGFAKNETPPIFSYSKKIFYHILKSFNAIKFSHKTISNLYPRRLSPHIYKAGYHDCTHAYALTFSAAEKLLKLQSPISFIPDNLLAHAATNEIVNAYIILPKIIDQEYQVGLSAYSYVNQ